jgi:hypothetical protein
MCDFSVGIMMGCGLDGPGSISGQGKRCLSSPQYSDWLWNPLILLSNGYQGLFLWRGEAAGHEAGRSPPSCSKVKNGGNILSPPPPYILMEYLLIN